MSQTRIFGSDYASELWITETEAGLEVTANAGSSETTVVLDANSIRKLRLTLQRIERARSSHTTE